MKKTYILEDLDCAHCAALIEEKVGKLDGVTKSTVTLLTQKLVVEVEDDKANHVHCIYWDQSVYWLVSFLF